VSKFKLSLTRALDLGPSLDESEKENKKRIKTSHTHKTSCQLQLQGRMSKFKLSLKRALDSCPCLDASRKKKIEKELKLLTLRGLAASCSFNVECQNSSSH
jgi:hypothetical protein